MAITRDQAYEILHKYMEGERYLETFPKRWRRSCGESRKSLLLKK